MVIMGAYERMVARTVESEGGCVVFQGCCDMEHQCEVRVAQRVGQVESLKAQNRYLRKKCTK